MEAARRLVRLFARLVVVVGEFCFELVVITPSCEVFPPLLHSAVTPCWEVPAPQELFLLERGLLAKPLDTFVGD